MATRAKTVCRHPGCGRLLDVSGYCDKHQSLHRQRSDERRGSANERGYTRKWQKAREEFLCQHPLCQCDECKARPIPLPASVVDHKVPHRLKDAIDSGDHDRIAAAQSLFWDRKNWMAMAKRCHDRKTAREDGGFGRISL